MERKTALTPPSESLSESGFAGEEWAVYFGLLSQSLRLSCLFDERSFVFSILFQIEFGAARTFGKAQKSL